MRGLNVQAFSLEQAPAGSRPISLYFDASSGSAIRRILLSSDSFLSQDDPAVADAIIFGSDELQFLDRSELFRNNPEKCLCITETDTPTFRMRGLYASNTQSYVTRGRTATVNYVISQTANPNPEIKRLIGQPVEKRYLYSFMGGTNCWARRRLFAKLRTTADTLVEATDSYNHWAATAAGREAAVQQRSLYAEVMAASKYALCPRGCGISSYRLFEAMSLGVAPVIISDSWQPTQGVDWSFALFVRERQIPKLDQIVRCHAEEWQERGRVAQATYRAVFAPEAVVKTMHGQMAGLLQSYDPGREALMARVIRMRVAKRDAYWFAYRTLKQVVLRGFHITGLPLPIRLHAPLEQQIRRKPEQVSS